MFSLNTVKVIAMFLTAAFGVMGTFKDYSEDKRPTFWRGITIAGIVLSAAMSIIIQNSEYRKSLAEGVKHDSEVLETTTKLQAIGDAATKNNKAAEKIQKDLKSNLDTTSTVKDQLQGSLEDEKKLVKGQNLVLGKQAESASAIIEIIHPLSLISFYYSLIFDVSGNSCLTNYVNAVQKKATESLLPDRSLPQALYVSLFVDPKTGEYGRISFDSRSPLFPSSTDRAYPVVSAEGKLQFHTASKPISYNAYDDGIVYELQSDQLPLRDSHDELWQRSAPISLPDKVTIDWENDKPTTIKWERTMVNARPIIDAQTFHSIRELVGSNLELFIGFEKGCELSRPRLGEFKMVWGQNFAFESQFDVSSFNRWGDEPHFANVNYVHLVTPHDLGFSPTIQTQPDSYGVAMFKKYWQSIHNPKPKSPSKQHAVTK
jgi:hypothetical protein